LAKRYALGTNYKSYGEFLGRDEDVFRAHGMSTWCDPSSLAATIRQNHCFGQAIEPSKLGFVRIGREAAFCVHHGCALANCQTYLTSR
jgi:hypothetical protein